MPTRPYVLAECTWKSVESMPYELAVLPWGATEAHNYHLPYGTDNIEAEAIAIESARLAWEQGARLVVLPCIPYGVNTGQTDIKLDVNMNPSTQASVLTDIVQSLAAHGIRKLVVFNGHGGNDFRTMIRELLPVFPDVFICQLNWWESVRMEDFFDEPGDHGGEMETSLMMGMAPGLLLPLREAGAGASKNFRLAGFREKWVWAPRVWRKATADTGIGNPARASADKGRRCFDAMARKIGDFLAQLSKTAADDLYA
jgi:creatinine amidohydrolase